MPKEIRNLQTYRKEFSGPPSDRALRTEALKHALDIRKFEIELYWKRATYFWTLIAATFAGYFLLWTSQRHIPGLIFLIDCLGIVLSISWYLVNRGSKYWQTNWERHVDILEDEIIGPLYKTTLAKKEFKFFSIKDGYPFSVSKVNQITSLFIAFVWVGMAVHFIISKFSLFSSGQWIDLLSYMILVVMTLFFVLLLFLYGRSEREATPRKINLRKAPLKNTHD